MTPRATTARESPCEQLSGFPEEQDSFRLLQAVPAACSTNQTPHFSPQSRKPVTPRSQEASTLRKGPQFRSLTSGATYSLSLSLSSHLSTCLPVCQSSYLPTYLSIYPSVRLSLYPSIRLSVHLTTSSYVHLPIYPSIRPCIHPCIHPCMHTYRYTDRRTDGRTGGRAGARAGSQAGRQAGRQTYMLGEFVVVACCFLLICFSNPRPRPPAWPPRAHSQGSGGHGRVQNKQWLGSCLTGLDG